MRKWLLVWVLCLSIVSCRAPRSGVLTQETLKHPPAAAPSPSGPQETSSLQICSRLDFNQLGFSPELTAFDQEAFKLALNITGSFEGHEGWRNITNDFDGQGLSLGLLNQTLGTGSLQPLLIKMRNNHLSVMQNIFSGTRLKSLNSMLNAWEANKSAFTFDVARPLSPLDEDFDLSLKAVSREQESVQWARNNLYTNGRFHSTWKQEFQNMASTPEYRQLQLNESFSYQKLSRRYMKRIGVNELRAFTFFFDIVVQNGGLYTDDLEDFETYLSARPNASSDERLKKILDLRLRHVRARFRQDVLARKTAFITGQGTVHRTFRDFPREYCFDQTTPY